MKTFERFLSRFPELIFIVIASYLFAAAISAASSGNDLGFGVMFRKIFGEE